MKRYTALFAIAMLVFAFALFITAPASAQTEDIEHGINFVDEDGDGYNDNAPDADGDGIPNGQDDDYTPAGNQSKKGNAQGGTGFVDEDGDGLNDNAPDADGDGIPNGQDEDYVRPENAGQGFGKGKGNGNGMRGFVDENGDGLNDNALDSDGDGVPNGQDADYAKPEDCLGRGAKAGSGFDPEKSRGGRGKGGKN